MTDGQVTKGSADHTQLASLVDPNYSNIFIGFGIDHDAELLQALAANTNSACYFVDNIENTGLIYGEILHGILYTALYNVKIEMQHGEIYDYKTNTWTTTLDIASLNSEAKKTYHVRATSTTNQANQEISAIITGKTQQPNQPQNIEENVDVIPDLLEEDQSVPVDLTKYMFRQRTMELLFEARTNNNRANRVANNNNITTIKNNKKIIKDKLKAFLKLLQAQMMQENKLDDDFYQTLCEDINIAYASFDSPVACMYTAARQHSQGRQLSYNVASPYVNQDQDQDQEQEQDDQNNPRTRTKSKYNYASPVKLRRQNALMMSPTQLSNHSPEYDEQFVLDDDDDEDEYKDDDQIVAQMRRPCLTRSNTTPKQEMLMRSVSEGTPYKLLRLAPTEFNHSPSPHFVVATAHSKQSPTFPTLMMPVNEGAESEIEALLSSLHQPPQPRQQEQSIYLFPETDPELVEGLKSLSASISDSNIRHEMITAEIKALELEKAYASVRVQKEKMA